MGLLDQFGSGLSREMVAGTLGAPVDLSTAALNGLSAGLGQLLPQGFPQISDPVGGSAWIAQRMRNAGMLSDQPGTAADNAAGLLPLLMAPVKPGAIEEARGLLGRIAAGERPKPIDIGTLTQQQLADLNAARVSQGLPTVGADLSYRGTHHYQSRAADGYSIDDMLAQISNGLSPQSQVVVDRYGRPNLVNQTPRADGYGNNVRDTVTFELSGGKKPELFSVIPKGDRNKPNGQ
ncbi:hypothetical protein CBA19CS91_01815 [Paraburkholderia hospita]|nr:hypothetical protein CBA19CS91_01815 [Paraburkholderia hospita]